MELQLFLGALRRNLALLVALAILGGAAGVGLALSPAAQYEATASVSVAQPNFTIISGTNNQLDPATYVATQVGEIDGTTVLNAAAAHAKITALDLQKDISVSQRQSSDIIDITAKSGSAGQASSLANLVADTYLSQLRASVASTIQSSEAALQSHINSLEAQLTTANPTQAAGIDNQLSTLETQFSADQSAAPAALTNTAIVNIADYPESPLPRHTAIKGALGLLGGLAIGVIAAVLVAAARPRMIRSRDVEQAIGVSTAAELPYVPEWRPELAPAGGVGRAPNRDWRDNPAFANEVTKIAVFIEAARSTRNCKTVLVTSLERTAGVSTLTAALAASLREGNRSVRLVSLAADEEERAEPEEQAVGLYGDRVVATGEGPWTGMSFSRMSRVAGAIPGGAFRRREERAALISDDDFDADILVMDGGNMTATASVVAVARSSDVTVLVVPLPAENERYLHSLTRAIFSDAKGQLLIVTNNLAAPRIRRSPRA